MRLGQLFGLFAAVSPFVACSSTADTQNMVQTSGGSIGNNGGATGTGGTSRALNTGGSATHLTLATGGAGGSSSSVGTKSAGGTGTTGGTSSTGGALGTGGNVSTGGSSSTGGAATGGTSAAPCPGTGGTSMVRLPLGYCIDSTEVTRDQYSAWLATGPALPASSDANCGWKSSGSYAPAADCMINKYACRGAACGNHPQICVDWCDAYAYCAGVGKRLCGKIGGGSRVPGSSRSQWGNACATNIGYTYPYGNTYSPTACNGEDLKKNTTVPVGSLTTCNSAGTSEGIFDLSGNVAEWEDSCDASGQQGLCDVRGGAFTDPSFMLDCLGTSTYALDSWQRSNSGSDLGFRCCSI